MNEKRNVPVTIAEREAMLTLRKAIKRRPELLLELMKDLAYESASSILLQAKREIEQTHAVISAFVAAANTLAQHQKESKHETEKTNQFTEAPGEAVPGQDAHVHQLDQTPDDGGRVAPPQ